MYYANRVQNQILSRRDLGNYSDEKTEHWYYVRLPSVDQYACNLPPSITVWLRGTQLRVMECHTRTRTHDALHKNVSFQARTPSCATRWRRETSGSSSRSTSVWGWSEWWSRWTERGWPSTPSGSPPLTSTLIPPDGWPETPRYRGVTGDTVGEGGVTGSTAGHWRYRGSLARGLTDTD